MKNLPDCAEETRDGAILSVDVKLVSTGADTSKIITCLRTSFDLSRTRAEELLKSPSIVAINVPIQQARKAKADLTALGCVVDFIPAGAITHVDAAPNPSEEQAPKHRASGITWLVVILFTAGLVALAVLLSDNSAPESDHGDKISSWTMCKQFVQDRLKAPSTADFPMADMNYVTDLGDDRFRVDAYVDAENSFGAKIRVEFSCVVQYQGDDNWELVSLTMDE